MAKLVYGLNVSLDGYVDHLGFLRRALNFSITSSNKRAA